MINPLKDLNIRYLPQRLLYPPTWVVLGVNNICNLHCKMCDVGTGFEESTFYQHMMGAQPVNMPKELAFRIIDEIQREFPRTRLGFAFTEPSVYPHLMEALEYAHSKNIFTSVTTNGLLLPRQAADLVRVGLNELVVSLDGPPQIHNEIRRNRKSFEAAFEGIAAIRAIDSNAINVSVACAITEWNIGHLTELADCFRSLPLNSLIFMHTVFNTEEVAGVHNAAHGRRYPTAPSNMEEIDLNKYNLRELFAEMQELGVRESATPIKWSPILSTYEEVEQYYRRPGEYMGTRCLDAFTNITIKSDGSVIPAHSRCYNVVAGNVYQNSLKEIWNASTLARFRSDLLAAGGLMPACSRCCSGFVK